MKSILILAAILLITVGAVDNCKNPLFTAAAFEKLGVDVPAFRAVAEDIGANSFCQSAGNTKSCCNEGSITSLNGAFEVYSEKLRAGFEQQLKSCVAQCNAMDAKKLGDEVVRATILTKMAKAAEECESLALDYTRSTLCLSCRAEVSELLDGDNLVMVNQGDVEGLRTACGNFLREYKTFQQIVKVSGGEQQGESLRPAACKKVSVRLTKDTDEAVELCMDKKLVAFHDYIRAVGEKLVEEWEFDADYKIKYENNMVSICDSQGCEGKEFSEEALKTFDAYVSRRFYLKRQAPVPAKQVDALVRAIAYGPFFDLDAFMNEEMTVGNELISLVDHKPVIREITPEVEQVINLQAASSNTTTNASSGSGGSNPNSAQNMSATMKTKLANASLQVGEAMGDNALALKVLLIPLGLILAIFA